MAMTNKVSAGLNNASQGIANGALQSQPSQQVNLQFDKIGGQGSIAQQGGGSSGTNVSGGGYSPESECKMSCHGADVSGHRQGTDAELLPLYITAMGIEILVPILPKALTITKADKLADAGEAGLKILRTSDDAVSTLQYASTVSKQKQMRHIAGTAPANKSYLNSLDDAQKVLDNFNSGNYKLISENIKQSTVTIRIESVSGRYINIGNPNGLPDVNKATNVFMIQSLKSPKIVPVNPNKAL
ncbi:polymorphic toxin type 50 domain-containing protein [Shewanella sp. ENK2]|uniref:polymorphic toxin type 50 domain-containing protein n=2 Tax=unclassified Shewanella TaxID=196818 RepID=UPI00374924A0